MAAGAGAEAVTDGSEFPRPTLLPAYRDSAMREVRSSNPATPNTMARDPSNHRRMAVYIRRADAVENKIA